MSTLRTKTVALVAAALALASAGCNAIGPTAIESARIPYNEAVAATRDQQMLLNIVRLKYRDTPLFLDVGSVSTQYQLNYGGGISGRFEFDDALDDHGLNASGSMSYSEKPTVTYVPLKGETYVKLMMSPIPLETILLMAQSGWSMNRIMRCCSQRMNGIRNAPSASGPTPAQVPEYLESRAISALSRKLQLADSMRLEQFVMPSGTVHAAVRFDASADPVVAGELKRRLGLDPETNVFPVRQQLGAASSQELVIETRSILGTMFFLSHAVEVPEGHVEAGKVTVTLHPDGTRFDWNEMTGDLLRVRSSDSQPDDAYVTVRYRGTWFYISDSDLTSKTTFSMLGYLFALQSGDRTSLVPALTLPL